LDLKHDYLGSPAKAGKENAAAHAKEDKADGNWPEVQIKVASKHSGSLLSALAVHHHFAPHCKHAFLPAELCQNHLLSQEEHKL